MERRGFGWMDGWRRRWWFTVTGLIKSSGRTGGTGSRALGVLLCPAAFYCSLMVCSVRACVCMERVNELQGNLWNLVWVGVWVQKCTPSHVCISTHYVWSCSFLVVEVNVTITEVLMSPDCRAVPAPRIRRHSSVHNCEIGTMCCCCASPPPALLTLLFIPF